MSDIITERSGYILRIQMNRPEKKNAMTLAMYITLADLLNNAAKDDLIRVVLWHGAGDSFSAGNDIQDFLKNPPGAGESPQARLIEALINFDKPIVAAVQGAAIGGGTTMLTHCDFVFAGESARRATGLQAADEIVNARATRTRGKTRESGILRASALGRSQRSVQRLP